MGASRGKVDMLITVSGPPGAGKSSTCEALAGRLGLEHISGGDIFRELAAERGLTLAEFNERAEEDDVIDRDLDRRLREIAVERDDVVLESRLSGWLAAEHADLRVWLDAPLSVRAERIAAREDKPVADARAETEERAASEAGRYHEYYGIDIDDRSIYDLVVNTARWDETVVPDLVVAAAEAYDPGGDEGKFPVEGVRYEF
jgi:cytidylate kinase